MSPTLQPLFSISDYVVLVAYLFLIVGIGVSVGRGQKNTEEYFLAGRSMGWFPIGISTLTSLYSAISFMGSPSEYFTHDLLLYVGVFSILPTALVVMYVFMPFYHRLQVYTAYEYLEERFDVSVRALSSGIFVFWRILWMATAIYVPSLVLNTVTGLPLLEMVLVVGVISTLYTVVGGMRAVIWTDVAQFFVLFGGSALALWVISSQSGSFSVMWSIAEQGGRTRLLEWSLDPTMRATTWAAFIGSLVSSLGMFGADQVSVQRYLAAKSLRVMQRSFILNAVAGLAVGIMMVWVGLGLFAFYTVSPDQLPESINGDKVFPYFIATQMPLGWKGMMIAAIMAAAMSSIDSGLNSSTTAIITDFFKRFRWNASRLLSSFSHGLSVDSASQELKLSRWLTLLLGVVITFLACFVGRLGSIMEIANKLVNSFAGPMIGVFLLGMLTRKTGAKGAFLGLLAGSVATSYVIFFSGVSFLWYGAIGMGVTLLSGWGISVLLDSSGTDRSDLVFHLFGS